MFREDIDVVPKPINIDYFCNGQEYSINKERTTVLRKYSAIF